MAKLPFALKAGHPMADKEQSRRWAYFSSEWDEVDAGVWAHAYSMEPADGYVVTLLSRDCGAEITIKDSNDILEVIKAARCVREDQHEVDVARATGEVE